MCYRKREIQPAGIIVCMCGLRFRTITAQGPARVPLRLVVSEIAFRRLDSVVFQLQFAKSRDALPLTRDYIHERSATVADSAYNGRRHA